MIGTYAAVLAVCGASLPIGQAAITLAGRRSWSWLAPAAGLGLLCPLCWGTVRIAGDGVGTAIAVLACVVLSVLYLRGRLDGGREALRIGLPVAVGALVAASLPFAVEGRFGILGTGFDPDMSQHLLAADRLAAGHASPLLHQGYPLGPHAIVVALHKGLGIGLVQGFSGLSVAVAVLASLTALAAFRELPAPSRTACALLVGIPYLVASYFAQGAFKEELQALFVLAFALGLRERAFVAAAAVALGSLYAYSFPGLAWLVGTAIVWLLLARPRRLRAARAPLLGFALLALPELGRMIDFHRFETFDPHGPGLGNLFGQISPLEALGIWPSGDFRLAPGDGAVPAVVYCVAAAFALVLLLRGLRWAWQRRESAILAAVATAAAAYVAARVGGTPYTAAKALAVAAPLVALVILLPPRRLSGAAYLCAAGACSLLALANAPIGPATYSPNLTTMRPLIASGSTVILAPPKLLSDEHGVPYLAWELRGGRVCIETTGDAGGASPPGVRFAITTDGSRRPPFRGMEIRRVARPYVLWRLRGKVHGRSRCPLIAVRQEPG